jgi:hypothetical protein
MCDHLTTTGKPSSVCRLSLWPPWTSGAGNVWVIRCRIRQGFLQTLRCHRLGSQGLWARLLLPASFSVFSHLVLSVAIWASVVIP